MITLQIITTLSNLQRNDRNIHITYVAVSVVFLFFLCVSFLIFKTKKKGSYQGLSSGSHPSSSLKQTKQRAMSGSRSLEE